jgi:uncharacterized membrane protein
MGDQSDKIKPTGKDETKPPNQEAGPGTGETAAAQDSSEEGVSKLADKAQELVAAAREKASEVAGETLDTTRESLKKAWDQTAEFAEEQKKKAQETIESVTEQSLVSVEKSAKATIVAARDAMQSMEKTAEELTEKLKDFTKRQESETVSGILAEERQMRLGHVAYLLYALGPVTLVSGLFGLMLCYLRLGESGISGTVLRSHFRWLIRTFWLAAGGLLLALIVGWAFGRFAGGLVLLVALIWFSYRLIKGWLSLYDGKEIARPSALW